MDSGIADLRLWRLWVFENLVDGKSGMWHKSEVGDVRDLKCGKSEFGDWRFGDGTLVTWDFFGG